MSRLAVVVMLPDDPREPARVDFSSREFDGWQEFADFMRVLEDEVPGWRIVSVMHVEDLPVVMEADGKHFRELPGSGPQA